MLKMKRTRNLCVVVLCVGLVWASAHAQAPTQAPVPPGSKQLAPGFAARPAGSRIVLVPPDTELFSITAGGMQEPRADWTETARKHLRHYLLDAARLGHVQELDERALDEFAELNSLHGAVAQSVFLHHMIGGMHALPTKAGVLDWSLGDAVTPLRERTGADYALFTWVRDSYASAERKATMVVMAILGVGLVGGMQMGYASLVDLRDGRVVWFGHLARGTGDLREEESAKETVDALLKGFPVRAKP